MGVLAQNTEFEKIFSKAENYYARGDYRTAEHLMMACYKLDSSNIQLQKKLHQLSVKQKHWKRVAVFSKKLKKKLPEEAASYHLQEVISYFHLQDYNKAEQVLKSGLKIYKMLPEEQEIQKKLAANIAFAKEAIKRPVPFEPKNLGPMINTAYAEYLPNLTQDSKYLIFTRKVARSREFPSVQEDFYVSKDKKGEWLKSIPLSKSINTIQNEGAPSISADGKMLYFAACNRKDSKGECDIYYSYNRGNFWTTPKNLTVINTKYWETQPNLSPDGKTLYFVSNRPGGIGESDIWAVDIYSDGSYGEAYNLGSTINTKYNEMSPFLHFDNQTLYFASDGWAGMGSKDIFLSRKQDNGIWSEPENLGYPINSSKSDNSFFVAADGLTAYFSSNREGGYGKEDIYQFDLYEKVRPQKTGYYKALFLDMNTKKPVDVSYIISNAEDSSQIQMKHSRNGDVSTGLQAGQKYILTAYAKGYLYYSSFISPIEIDSLKLVEEKIYLEPISVDKNFELKNIEFDFDKAVLKSASTKELDLFANYLQIQKNLKILIEGHTDNKGTHDYNLKLSQERAEAVKGYLISKGISMDRLETKGFGSSQMLSKKEHLQDRNRRVLIRVIDN